MWAQIIEYHVKTGSEQEMHEIEREFAQRIGEGRGPQRAILLQNQNNPNEYYNIVLFENEASARQNEGSPDQEAAIQRLRGLMADPPKYVDCNVVRESGR